jgi:purine-binding chemotaxis protein CheW
MDQLLPALPVLGEQEAAASQKVPTRVCILTVAGSRYTVDLRHVREVFPIESITPMPGMPPVIIGMTNVRGAVVPIVDIRLLLGLPRAKVLSLFAVVLWHEEYQLAVLVDCSPEIMAVLPDQFGPVPNNSTMSAEVRRFSVNDGVNIDEVFIPLLKVAEVVAYLESEASIESV